MQGRHPQPLNYFDPSRLKISNQSEVEEVQYSCSTIMFTTAGHSHQVDISDVADVESPPVSPSPRPHHNPGRPRPPRYRHQSHPER